MSLAAPLRLGLAGGVLVLLLGGGLLADAWARGPAGRATRRPRPHAPLVEVRPAVVRHFAPTRPVQRAAAAARALLGAALLVGVAVHLRRGGRARPVACVAALLGAAWALGTAVERFTRSFDNPYLKVTLGTQSGGFTLYDLYLALALLLGAMAGLWAALRAQTSPSGGRP